VDEIEETKMPTRAIAPEEHSLSPNGKNAKFWSSEILTRPKIMRCAALAVLSMRDQ